MHGQNHIKFLWGSCKQPFAELPEIRLQRDTKNTLPSLAFGFFPPEKCGAVSDGERFHEDIFSMEKRYQGKRNCAMFADYCSTWAKDAPTMEHKRQKKKFVLNNDLTWKRLCRCSIYVVNVIPKQNKSTKHILFHWLLFSFLFNPPFLIIFQPIS